MKERLQHSLFLTRWQRPETPRFSLSSLKQIRSLGAITHQLRNYLDLQHINKWKLHGLHLEEGKTFCFTFWLFFLSTPQFLHNFFLVNFLFQPHMFPLIYTLSAMLLEQPCNKSLHEEWRLVLLVLSSAASRSWWSTSMNPLCSCSMGETKLYFRYCAKVLE